MQDFFQNVFRYPRYLISISLGIFAFAYKKVAELFKKSPAIAIALSVLLAGGFVFITLTLRAMLGLGPS